MLRNTASRQPGGGIRVACCLWLLGLIFASGLAADEAGEQRIYPLRLVRIPNPAPLLADHPEFVEPIRETERFEAPILVDDPDADLSVRAWRTQFNARGMIEMPNRLKAARTAVIVVHPWGLNDGQGWKLPEPAGFALGSPPAIRHIARHLEQVVNPFLKSMRGKAGLVMYSLRGAEHPIHAKIYRSIRGRPTEQQRQEGRAELSATLNSFSYRAGSLPSELRISKQTPVKDYFQQLPGGQFGDHYNGPGFWDLPIPVHSAIKMDPEDVVIYDQDGYEALKAFLKKQGIAHILLCGYSCSKCYRKTTAGYENLRNDFNVFLVGDATLEVKMTVDTIRFATAGELAEVSRENLITQISWIRLDESGAAKR